MTDTVPLSARSTSQAKRMSAREEVQAREGHHIDGQLAQIRVELAREAKGCSTTGHDMRDEPIEVSEGRRGSSKRFDADIVERFVVDLCGLRTMPDLAKWRKRTVNVRSLFSTSWFEARTAL